MKFVQQAKDVIVIQNDDFMYSDTNENYRVDTGLDVPTLNSKYDHRVYIPNERHSLSTNDGSIMDGGPNPWDEGDQIIDAVKDILDMKKDRESKGREAAQKKFEEDTKKEALRIEAIAKDAAAAERSRKKSKDELRQYAAIVRNQKQFGGFVSANYGDVLTDLVTTSTMSGLVLSLSQGMVTAPISFKSPRGWVQLDEQTIKGMAKETAIFIQQCFQIEHDVSLKIDQSTITNQDQIDQAFA